MCLLGNAFRLHLSQNYSRFSFSTLAIVLGFLLVLVESYGEPPHSGFQTGRRRLSCYSGQESEGGERGRRQVIAGFGFVSNMEPHLLVVAWKQPQKVSSNTGVTTMFQTATDVHAKLPQLPLAFTAARWQTCRISRDSSLCPTNRRKRCAPQGKGSLMRSVFAGTVNCQTCNEDTSRHFQCFCQSEKAGKTNCSHV